MLLDPRTLQSTWGVRIEEQQFRAEGGKNCCRKTVLSQNGNGAATRLSPEKKLALAVPPTVVEAYILSAEHLTDIT